MFPCYLISSNNDMNNYEMGSTAEFRRAFVQRLKQACDESRHIPAPGKGRQQAIADALGVGPEAASKWFKGMAKTTAIDQA
jgi:hypothetical protein